MSWYKVVIYVSPEVGKPIPKDVPGFIQWMRTAKVWIDALVVRESHRPKAFLHHHHFYDENRQPAVLEHAHEFTNVRHLTDSIRKGLPIYWDHEGLDCDGIEEKE